ncbi:MAG: hypothetical protein JXK05_11635 [Campylobacterales bacterium]|nr:hypothetical protein [Campylobacterales bacterium]
MKHTIAVLLCTLSLQATTYHYECMDGYELSTTIQKDAAKLHLPRGNVTLSKTPSPDGNTYTDGKMKLVLSDNTALLWLDALGAIECRLSSSAAPKTPTITPPTARVRHSVRAAGYDWTLDLTPKEGLLSYNKGLERLSFITPTERKSGDFTNYIIRQNNARLIIDLQERPCTNIKGERLALTASVNINGRSLRGCAERLAQ